jgi:hypothetical protein
MLEKIITQFIAQLAIFLIEYLDKKIQKGSVAIDAIPDPDRLQRAGDRLSQWLREQNSSSVGEQPSTGGTTGTGESIHPIERGMESER